MGSVYRGFDVTIDRDGAIKVSPEASAPITLPMSRHPGAKKLRRAEGQYHAQ